MLALRIAKVSLDRWHMDSVCELFSLSRGTIAVPDQECFTPCMPFPPLHPSHRSSYQFLHAILSHRARITIFRVDRKTRTGNHCNGGGLLEVWMHAFFTIPSFSSLIIPSPPCHPNTVHLSRLKDGTIVSFFVSSLTDDIFVLKYSAYIQTSTSPPPLQWPPVLAFLSTRSCDSSEVGEDGMEELVWSTMRRMEW